MLSFERGDPKAIIDGGVNDGKILHIFDPTRKCCAKCTEKCNSRVKCCEDCKGGCLKKCSPVHEDVMEVLDDDYVLSLKKKMTRNDLKLLKSSLKSRELDTELLHMQDVYDKTIEHGTEIAEREFNVWDDGAISPLPDFENTFRYYACGPTDSGKSYYVGKILRAMRKVHPKKKIYIFSDVDADPALDRIGVTRLKLDEALINKKPIEPSALKNSVCVFDDIDSIQNDKLLKVVGKLRDSILRRGRHEDISCIVTSHLATNYKETKVILNECNAITFFPKSGATSAIRYVLKNYVGMGKKDIDKIFTLPSRWITVFKNSPQYVIHEKGMYLL